MNTHNIWFCGEITKILLFISDIDTKQRLRYGNTSIETVKNDVPNFSCLGFSNGTIGW